ncbi:MAG: MogA/MoaB family molybdenum cofactor biosynthesis protein [Dehalococcoidia bacterium]|nr:MogA/MoaB family molybdenum cofactor biosynthesis protein [Dehalococcoidia bacterium]
MAYKAGILTVDNKGYAGKRKNSGGDLMVNIFRELEIIVAKYEIVPSDPRLIAMTLSMWADSGEVDFIVTTGGTGISPGDVTPEATRSVIEKELPGIVETLRADGYINTPTAMLSRGMAGIRGKCLIVNFPENAEAVQEYLDILLPVIPHAVEILHGGPENYSQITESSIPSES